MNAVLGSRSPGVVLRGYEQIEAAWPTVESLSNISIERTSRFIVGRTLVARGRGLDHAASGIVAGRSTRSLDLIHQ